MHSPEVSLLNPGMKKKTSFAHWGKDAVIWSLAPPGSFIHSFRQTHKDSHTPVFSPLAFFHGDGRGFLYFFWSPALPPKAQG